LRPSHTEVAGFFWLLSGDFSVRGKDVAGAVGFHLHVKPDQVLSVVIASVGLVFK
jgi:hypothetical protein